LSANWNDDGEQAAEAWLRLGNLYASYGDDDRAEDALRRAADTGHREYAPSAWCNLGSLLDRRGGSQGESADVVFVAALNLGIALINVGDTQGGKESYMRGIEVAGVYSAQCAVNLGGLPRMRAIFGMPRSHSSRHELLEMATSDAWWNMM
jgi:hypothetical protein